MGFNKAQQSSILSMQKKLFKFLCKNGVKNNYHNGLFKVEGKNSIVFAILLFKGGQSNNTQQYFTFCLN